ncbi:MAG: hypothetical protein Q8Q14_02635 [Gemmatimonadales bacterium]|nr:hypothetical protein [Gemmatimonadales bacterium]
MANAIYPLAKEALANAEIDLNTDTLVAYLVDGADYTYSAAHVVLADLPAGARVDVTATLGSPTIAVGVIDTADSTFEAATGDVSEIVILYDVTSDNLIAYYDTGITGIPVTPNGGDITLAVHGSGWFSI